MSLCTVVLNNQMALVGADTRVCSSKNTQHILGDYPKLQNINNKYLIFGSGTVKVCLDVFEKLRKIDTSDIEEIQKVIQEITTSYYNKLTDDEIGNLPRETRDVKGKGKILFQTFVIVKMENGLPTMYQISNFDDYQINKHINVSESITYGCAGAKVEEATQVFKTNIQEAEDTDNIYQVVCDSMQDEYNRMSNTEIGGELHIYTVDKSGIKMIYKNDIQDLYLDGHCHMQNGHILMERSDKTFKSYIDENEFTFYKGDGKGAYEKTVYIDANGNAIFSGTVKAADIIGGTINGTSINTDKDVSVGESLKIVNGDNNNFYFTISAGGITGDRICLEAANKRTIEIDGGAIYLEGNVFVKGDRVATQEDINDIKGQLRDIKNQLSQLSA